MFDFFRKKQQPTGEYMEGPGYMNTQQKQYPGYGVLANGGMQQPAGYGVLQTGQMTNTNATNAAAGQGGGMGGMMGMLPMMGGMGGGQQKPQGPTPPPPGPVHRPPPMANPLAQQVVPTGKPQPTSQPGTEYDFQPKMDMEQVKQLRMRRRQLPQGYGLLG